MRRIGSADGRARLLVIGLCLSVSLAWTIVWAWIATSGLGESATTALQLVGAMTTLCGVVMYSVTTRSVRHRLMWAPPAMLAPFSCGVILTRLSWGGPAESIGEFTRNVAGFLIFPAGALAIGLATALVVDVMVSGLRGRRGRRGRVVR